MTECRIDIRDRVLKAEVAFSGIADRPLVSTIARWSLWQGFDLRNARLEPGLRKLAEADNLLNRLQLSVQTAPGSPLPISGTKTADSLPWEAFLALFDGFSPVGGPVRYVPIRQTDPVGLADVPAVDGAPRMLLLIGDGGTAFDTSEIGRTFLETARAAGFDADGAKGTPLLHALDLPRSDPAAAIRQAALLAPQFVIVYAHGRAKPEPAILLDSKSDSWLRLDDLARCFPERPLYWIVIACSVGENDGGDDLARWPDAFTLLAAEGAVALLAMRSRIRPVTGRALFGELLGRIAAGESLEYAAAGARQTLLALNSAQGVGLWDWASPAVWTRGSATARYKWTDSRLPDRASARQGLAVLRATVKRDSLGTEPAKVEDVDRARRWIEAKRVYLQIPPGGLKNNPEARQRLGDIIEAARSAHGCVVAPIDPAAPDGRFFERVRAWANAMRGLVPLEGVGADYAQSLAALAKDVQDGVERLVALPGAFVLFFETPPPGFDWNLFKAMIERAPETATLVICGEGAPQDPMLSGWLVDGLDDVKVLAQQVQAALDRHPRALALLALLPRPVTPAALGELTGEAVADGELDMLVVSDSQSGILLKDAARALVRAQLDGDKVAQACEGFVAARREGAAPTLRLDSISELSFLVEAGRVDEAIKGAVALADADSAAWGPVDWMKLGRLLSRLSNASRIVPAPLILEIARSYIERQLAGEALYWLEAAIPAGVGAEARRHMLLSEAFKALADKERMWGHARAAAKLLDEQIDEDPDLLPLWTAARGNLARLHLYFEHNASAAESEMRQVAERLQAFVDSAPSDRVARRDLAATRRNLAECLFEFMPFAAQPDQKEEARLLLENAIAEAKAAAALDVAAEAAYSLAKLHEVEGRLGPALESLGACAELARQGQYGLLFRLAELRKFWVGVRRKGEAFDAGRFRSLQLPLESFVDHAWAARYAFQSRIWAARCLEADNHIAAAFELLETLSLEYDRGPRLSAASDLEKRVITAAGQHVMAGRLNRPSGWLAFAATPPIAAWLQARGGIAPETIWRN
jgi:hypothetical protein